MTRPAALVVAVVLCVTPAAGWSEHSQPHVTVAAGDSLSELADAYDVPGGWPRMAWVNDLTDPHTIHVGDVLRVPRTDGKRWVPPRPSAAVSRSLGTWVPSSNSTGGSVGSSGHNWAAVAACESGGDWSANTGNGYFGGLQHSLSTWRAYGGSGYPHEASREAQIAVAERVLAGQGASAWPHCGRYL